MSRFELLRVNELQLLQHQHQELYHHLGLDAPDESTPPSGEIVPTSDLSYDPAEDALITDEDRRNNAG